MGNLANHQRTSGAGIHIGDCYVWAAISYLDSQTDYREYLPQDCIPGHTGRGNLVMLKPHDLSQGLRTSHLPVWPLILLSSLLFLVLVRFIDVW
jgi:hypothetical protein